MPDPWKKRILRCILTQLPECERKKILEHCKSCPSCLDLFCLHWTIERTVQQQHFLNGKMFF